MTHVNTAFSLRRILAPALLLAIATAAMPASADVPNATQSLTVSYGDLDVTHEAGIKVLYGRIQSAAHNVCQPLSTLPGLKKTAFDKCVSDAASNAVRTIGQPALTSLYEQKTGVLLPTRLASLEVR